MTRPIRHPDFLDIVAGQSRELARQARTDPAVAISPRVKTSAGAYTEIVDSITSVQSWTSLYAYRTSIQTYGGPLLVLCTVRGYATTANLIVSVAIDGDEVTDREMTSAPLAYKAGLAFFTPTTSAYYITLQTIIDLVPAGAHTLDLVATMDAAGSGLIYGGIRERLTAIELR